MKGIIALIFIRILGWLPLCVAQTIGALIGWALIFTPNDIKRISTINIKRCFPKLTPTQQRKLVRKNLIQTAITIAEMPAMWTHNPKKLAHLVRQDPDAYLPIQQAQDKGDSIIFLSPHHGTWELNNIVLSSYFNLITLYRTPKIKALDSMIRKGRSRIGTTMAPATLEGVKTLYKALRDKQILAMLPDQDPGNVGGCFATFMGQPAWTMTLIHRLSQKRPTSVFMFYMERLGIGKGYRLHVKPMRPDFYDKDPKLALTAMNADIEDYIHIAPEQYLWSYKRFKRLPEGYADIYKKH